MKTPGRNNAAGNLMQRRKGAETQIGTDTLNSVLRSPFRARSPDRFFRCAPLRLCVFALKIRVPTAWFRLSALVFIFTLLHAAFTRAAETNAFSESALAELTKPSKKIPFKTVIHATTGFRVLDLNTNNPAHVALRGKILKAAALAGERARKEGISSVRANEAGNHLEPFVRTALRDAGLEARIPVTTAGHAQATGYPDIEITGATPCYLELKSYNAATADTTQRTFYYSPSATPKITRDALHFLLAYELEKVTRQGEALFVPAHWKLLTLQDLEVDLKSEFNQSNRGMYRDGKLLLDEGELK